MRPDPAPEPGTGRARAALDLATLLREERALILAGAWARVEGLGPRKAACLAALGGSPTGAHADDLAPLAGDLARNQALLLAAIGGFRDARLRRAMLRSARAGFATYDARGGRGQVLPTRPTFERKA